MKHIIIGKKHPLLFLDDIHIHGCIDGNYLSHLKSSCFIFSLFGLYFGGGSSFTSWMKEHMLDYLEAHYIFFEKHYWTWDPRLCQWGISNIILYACVYGPHDDLLTWMYKHFHDSLVRYLLDVHLYDALMYFNDLYCVLMMFGRVQYQKWDPGIAWFPLTWSSSLVIGLRKQTNLQLFEFIFAEQFSVSYVGDLLRDGFNFHMIGVHGISS